MRVLLAGFGPFPGAPLNPSAAVAQALARRRRPALADLDRSLHVFPTAYAAVDHDLPKLFADEPDIILIFGLAGRRRQICIETRARNALSVLFPDASGRRPSRGVIEVGWNRSAAWPRTVPPFAVRGTREQRAHPAVARCRTLFVQLRLLACAKAGAAPRAARPVHPYSGARAACATAASRCQEAPPADAQAGHCCRRKSAHRARGSTKALSLTANTRSVSARDRLLARRLMRFASGARNEIRSPPLGRGTCRNRLRRCCHACVRTRGRNERP